MMAVINFEAERQRAQRGKISAATKEVAGAVSRAIMQIDPSMSKHGAAACLELYGRALLDWARDLRAGPDGIMGQDTEEPGDGDA